MTSGDLLAAIDDAFAGVPAPDPDALMMPRDEDSIDDEDHHKEREYLGGIREALAASLAGGTDSERMIQCSWALSYLTPEARRYFLPLWMRLAIGNPESGCSEAIFLNLEDERPWEVERLYTDPQKQAVVAFLRYLDSRWMIPKDFEFQRALDIWSE